MARVRTLEHFDSLIAGLLCQVGRFEFQERDVGAIEQSPIVYWWSRQFLARYTAAPKLGAASPARATEGLYNNTRFTRTFNETRVSRGVNERQPAAPWVLFLNGADGAIWLEPLRLVASGAFNRAQGHKSTKVGGGVFRYANEQYFFRKGGVAFASIGATFSARLAVTVSLQQGVVPSLSRLRPCCV
jgi:hypothetical protein